MLQTLQHIGVSRTAAARLLRRLGYQTQSEETSRRMYHTTGLTREQIEQLCEFIAEDLDDPGSNVPGRSWPPCLGLFGSLLVTLTYLRRNRVQAEIGEAFNVSQPTVSRAVAALTPLVQRALACWVPVAEDIDPDTQHLVDGTLVPCWSWAKHLNCSPASTRPPG